MILVWRIAELLLLVIAIIAVAVFIALSRESGAASLPALLIAILSAVGVYLTDKRIKRLSKPQPITIPPDFRGPLKVYLGKKRLVILAAGGVVLLAPAPFMYESGKHGLAIACAVFGILLLLAFLSDIRKMAIPYLMLDDQGITAHLYGRIPWDDVDNASLQVIEARGVKNYILRLSVYMPEKYIQRLGLLHRLFKLKWLELPSERGQLGIPLSMLSHEPLYIDAVVKHLRAQYSRRLGITPKTGDLSIDRRFSEADKLMASRKHDDNPEKIHSTMAKIDGLMGEVNQEIQDDRNKSRKETVILIAVSLALVGFFVAIKVMGK